MRGVFAFALLAASTLTTIAPVAAATVSTTTTCSNGVDDTPGLGLICQVTVVNVITASSSYAKVTIRECHGAAGAPTAACSTRTTLLNRAVTRVRQCNYATNGGGGTLRCSVRVTNNFVQLSAGASKASVNQCVGSGDGIANDCDPFPATTSGATITQCNGSANGGTLVRLLCTASGTKSSALNVTVNQCNNSANGGGALVHCSANIENRSVTAAPTDFTAPPTSSSDEPGAGSNGGSPLLPIGLSVLLAMWITLVYIDRRNRATA